MLVQLRGIASSFFIATLLLSAGCSSKSSGGGGASAIAGTPQLQNYSQAACDRFQRCDPVTFQSFFADPTTCPGRYATLTQAEYGVPGVTVTAAELDACAGSLKTASCDDEGSGPCAFTGSLAVGAVCSSPAQCTTGSCFFASDASGQQASCGVCAARVPEGGDCTKADCESALFCVDNKCVTPVAVGQACDDSSKPCAVNLACASGTCQAALPKDAVCGLSNDSVFCDETQGLECTPTTTTEGKCTPVQFAKIGAQCGLNLNGATAECIGSSCSNGVCVADANEGEACDDTKGPFCAFGFNCTAGKCTASVGGCN